MSLRKELGILSKSSPYSVSTLRIGQSDYQLKAKDYLYVESDIDIEFEAGLKLAENGDLLFLCGSSGDGKSEILTRLCRNPDYSDIKFHLDATHSKTQHGSAVDFLDRLFDEYVCGNFTLAIGINIGMMQKFLKFGADRHKQIKVLLADFLLNRHVKRFKSGNATFFDFESYPRLDFDSRQISSNFVTSFLANLTRADNENPFWNAYKVDQYQGLLVAKNYKLLSDERIQQGIIELLGLIRLYDEQFLVPRTFVDFIYKLIVSDSSDGLIGNLFSSMDNDISAKILSHDPIKRRSEELDEYLLANATNTLDQESIACAKYLDDFAGVKLSRYGAIRLASILSETIKSKFPGSYLSRIPSTTIYKVYLELHQIFNKSQIHEQDEDKLISVLEDDFLRAVIKYINRAISLDLNGYVLSRDVRDFFICNKVDIALDFEKIEQMSNIAPESIRVPFIVNEDKEVILDLDIKLLSLVEKIGSGFLPNRNLLNEYAKLDEFIRDIISATSKSEEIKVYRKDNLDMYFAEVKKRRRGYTLKGACSVN
ncbi:DNA phosphorothioation-dependent restriction protein DptF [Aliikangiella sp. IMCC44359]|uniref:DNA phosphorothioation-dependent restriction protein DptF n=1 Tax=Aliikangiella sp. IMCC44359 TaxID=3459125 RepID=UPI00403A7CA0